MLSPPMRTARPAPSPGRVRRLLISVSATLLIAFLTAFHAVLFWQRILDLSLFEPVPALRWLATVALLYGLWRLHRRGVSLLRGRGAVVLWLLILLLHVSFWGPLAEPTTASGGWAGTGLLLALPALPIILGAIFPTIRKLLARVFLLSPASGLPESGVITDNQSHLIRAGVLPALSCRPPPPAYSH